MLAITNPTVIILQKAKAKIADPDHWTQGVAARDAAGTAVHAGGGEAARWCALGAVLEVTVGDDAMAAVDLLNAAAGDMGVTETTWDSDDSIVLDIGGPLFLAQLNDQGTHADVMQMFDLAIKKALLK